MNKKKPQSNLETARRLIEEAYFALPDYSDGRNDVLSESLRLWLLAYDCAAFKETEEVK